MSEAERHRGETAEEAQRRITNERMRERIKAEQEQERLDKIRASARSKLKAKEPGKAEKQGQRAAERQVERGFKSSVAGFFRGNPQARGKKEEFERRKKALQLEAFRKGRRRSVYQRAYKAGREAGNRLPLRSRTAGYVLPGFEDSVLMSGGPMTVRPAAKARQRPASFLSTDLLGMSEGILPVRELSTRKPARAKSRATNAIDALLE